jgi:hypothetical protein
MSTNIPTLFDKDGNIVTNHWINDLINKPNGVQSWSDVVYSMSVQDALYSNVVAYCPLRSFGVRNLIITLPNNKIRINLSGKKLKQMEANDLITSFEFTYDDGSKETIIFDDTVYLTTADGMNIVRPISRIDSLRLPLSNIMASYNKRNVLLENLGAIGILSAQSNDMGGAIPMTPDAVWVKPLPDYRLEVAFTTGEIGYFDLKPYLTYPAFAPLLQDNLFMKAQVIHGVITWNDDIDLSPDTLYLRSQKSRSHTATFP